MVTVPARRELVRYAQSRGLSERRALRLACLSPSVLGYERKDDGNGPLRERMGRQGRAFAERFSWDASADGVERILREVVVEGRRH